MARLKPEAEFQDAVVKYARFRGWTVAHFRKATVRAGRIATPVAYDASGFPDLTMVRAPRLIFVEVKAKGGRLSWQQEEWLDRLGECPCEVYVWRPKDWPEIEEVLK